jgi:hypothetical protein
MSANLDASLGSVPTKKPTKRASTISMFFCGFAVGGLVFMTLTKNVSEQAALQNAAGEYAKAEITLNWINAYRDAVSKENPATQMAIQATLKKDFHPFSPEFSSRPIWLAALIGPDRTFARRLAAGQIDGTNEGP